jgi:hypothetical protein
MDKPNIFDFATSELSQDAFFCWLMQWADQKYRESELNKCANEFIKKLLPDNTVTEINTVSVYKQWENIDIWVTINEEIALIIEDKINAKEHDEQLKRYEEKTNEWCDKKNIKKRFFVFLKTATMSQYEKDEIRKYNQNWKVVERHDVLEVLNHYSDKISSDFFCDYLKQLSNFDDSEKNYKKQPVKEWDYSATTGFFKRLELELNEWFSWDWVNNPSGGFLGGWWHWIYIKKLDLSYYLQIQKSDRESTDDYDNNIDLFIRVDASNLEKDDRKDFRNKSISMLESKLSDYESQYIVHPKRLSTGNYMSIKRVKQEYWLSINDEGIVDVKGTVNKLKEISRILDRFK